MAAVKVRGFFQRCGQKFKEYIKNMANDYKTVAMDTVTGCKERPLKAAVVFSGLGFIGYAYKTNPSEISLKQHLCELRQRMVLVPQSEHNPTTASTLTNRNFLIAQNRLHHYNLWFFSLLLSTKQNDNLRVYSSQDPNLKDWPWTEFYNSIVDVGYLGRWHNLDSAFVDYDINTDEINLLPDDN
ncbi:unnamed protein product [Caenorhabditis angaria]|uniref:Uncharacterized protein n=1 Tax=Caenorhabditis angaria TaxID=860376 RepID=A0A9P1IX25_9PELO|nr:unnamed protein product [Caenorhabditis angaria]